jgi:hypothetical protein
LYMSPSLKIHHTEFQAVVDELTQYNSSPLNPENIAGNPDAIKGDRGTRKARGLSSLCDFYALHHADELAFLLENWGTYAMIHPRNIIYTDRRGIKWFGPHYQPLDQIRDYYGEHVALYFAWVGLYTRWLVMPAALGCITMAGYAIWDEDNNRFALVQSVVLSLWSTLFLGAWERLQSELKFKWGSEGFEDSEEPRPQFRGRFVKSERTGVERLVHKAGRSMYKRMSKIMLSWATVLTMIFLTAIAATNAYLVRELADSLEYEPVVDGIPGLWVSGVWVNITDAMAQSQQNGTAMWKAGAVWDLEQEQWMVTQEPDTGIWSKRFKYLSSVCSLCAIVICSIIYKSLSIKLTTAENHRTQTEYDDALIVKNFMFEFINNYFTLFFIAFFMNIDIPLQNMWNTIAGALGCDFPERDITPCPGSSCMGVLQRQLGTIFTAKQVIIQVRQAVKPRIKRYSRLKQENLSIHRINASLPPGQPKFATTFDNPIEEQRIKEPYDSNFDDFKEMSIQFGYVTLFAVSFPLAALFAWINNISEIRLDASLICRMHRRAVWRMQEDIGSWGMVFESLSIANVITNACLVAFVGSQLATILGETSPDPDVQMTFVDRLKLWKMWAAVLVMEHAIFFSKFILDSLQPLQPAWIADAREALRLRAEGDLKSDGASVAQMKEIQALKTTVKRLEEQVQENANALAAAVRNAKQNRGKARTKRKQGGKQSRAKQRQGGHRNEDSMLESTYQSRDMMMTSTYDASHMAQSQQMLQSNIMSTTAGDADAPQQALRPMGPPPVTSGMNPADAAEAQALQRVWQHVDHDGSGMLDATELRQVRRICLFDFVAFYK